VPELPEVETIARGLSRLIAGRTITRVQIHTPGTIKGPARDFTRLIEGKTIASVGRRGKLLLIRLNGPTLVIHLKMTGRLWVSPGTEKPTKHTRLALVLDNGDRLNFEDMRKFGYCLAVGDLNSCDWTFYRDLGPEPLDIGEDEFVRLFTGRKTKIKSLLLDQRVVAGIGNIYADEALFRAKIRPDARASEIPPDRLTALCRAIKKVLTEAIAAGGSSFRDYRDAYGAMGAFQNKFSVYGKAGQPCPGCGQTLARMKVAGRTSTFCPRCQG